MLHGVQEPVTIGKELELKMHPANDSFSLVRAYTMAKNRFHSLPEGVKISVHGVVSFFKLMKGV